MSGKSSSSSSSGGIGFAGLLTIVFITLKLLGYISWSWVWVLSPIWISLILVVLVLLVVLVIAVKAGQQSMHPTCLPSRPPSLILAWRVSPLLSLILSHAGNTAVGREEK